MTDGWKWWAGLDEEWMTVGPCETKDQAINEAIQDGIGEWKDDAGNWFQSFHVVEAKSDPLVLSDWIGLEWILEKADEQLCDSDRVSCEYDDGPWFDCTKDQEIDLMKSVKDAVDKWQARHNLVFTCTTFSAMRNDDFITVECKSE